MGATPSGTSTVFRSSSSARNCLRKQVVRRFEVTGLPDDDAVDRVDAQAALDDRDESLVLGTVDHDDGRVRFVLLDEFVGLACDAPVGADAVAAVPEHYDDRVVAVGFEVAGHAPLEHRVDATVFRVVDTDLGDGGFDGTLTVYRQGRRRRETPARSIQTTSVVTVVRVYQRIKSPLPWSGFAPTDLPRTVFDTVTDGRTVRRRRR